MLDEIGADFSLPARKYRPEHASGRRKFRALLVGVTSRFVRQTTILRT
jgi:hypothetical protein